MTRLTSSAVAVSPSDHDAREAAESERALLGALLRDSDTAWPLVKDVVTLTHFARADHRLIFGAIVGLVADGVRADPFLIIDKLGPTNLEAAGGREYIAELYADTVSAANAGSYARIVRQFAGRAEVVNLAERIQARNRLESPAAAADYAQAEVERIRRDYGGREPLVIPPAASWATSPAPEAREWILDGFIPAGRVTSLFGVGGLGKTLLALQIGLHVSMGRPLFDVAVKGGPVLGIFCEDEDAELNRRVRSACASEHIDLAAVDRFHAMSRDGLDSYLCTFEHDHIRLTAFHAQLDATIAALKPTLVILDTAADLFAGDFMSTPHVRQFIKIALGGLCVRHGCAVLLLAHPSKAGLASGEGDGFSTAWSNSVRSRLYLSQPKAPEAAEGEDALDVTDKRVLEVKKSNYGRKDVLVPLTYVDGYFMRDEEPVAARSPRASTSRISIAAYEHIRSLDPAVASFRGVFDELQRNGVIPEGQYEVRRKPLFRALRQLIGQGLIRESTVPKGYRVAK